MLIGIDFDNTIVSYDALFHAVALEKGLVPDGLPMSKLAVRDHLRGIGQEERWTEMQGYVYGVRMVEAQAYDGVVDFMRDAKNAGHSIVVVSHKTRHPFLGPKHDLHAAARAWIEKHLVYQGAPLVEACEVFFELTKDEKIARIASCGCDVFIDDLPEILLAAEFPVKAARFLFDPDGHHSTTANDVRAFHGWKQIAEYIGK